MSDDTIFFKGFRGEPDAPAPAPDNVSRPQHYVSPSGLECIDVIESFGLGFALGNAIKYILRAGKKGERTEDLKKARWYLEREIGEVNFAHTGRFAPTALGAEAERDKLQAEVLHLRALIAEHTEDETCWRETAEVSSKHLHEWREWAKIQRDLHTGGMRAGEATDTHMMDLIAELALQPMADTTDWHVVADSWRAAYMKWQDWAQDLTGSPSITPVGMILPDAGLREVIARLTRRQPPKRKRKAKK